MDTTELADQIATEHGISKTQAKSIIESVLKGITDALAGGAEVLLPGFGKFAIRELEAREGLNPATGETIKIAALKKLAFLPAKALKVAVNGSGGGLS